MEILIKAKFNKGDRVIVKTIDDVEKLPAFVLAEVCDVKQIVKINADFNKITYDLKTYKLGGCLGRYILAEENQIYSFEEFTKLFNNGPAPF